MNSLKLALKIIEDLEPYSNLLAWAYGIGKIDYK